MAYSSRLIIIIIIIIKGGGQGGKTRACVGMGEGFRAPSHPTIAVESRVWGWAYSHPPRLGEPLYYCCSRVSPRARWSSVVTTDR